MAYLAGDAMGSVERDYMWNSLGIRDWIVRGGHMTDDWIMASCLSGMCVFFLFLFFWGWGTMLMG